MESEIAQLQQAKRSAKAAQQAAQQALNHIQGTVFDGIETFYFCIFTFYGLILFKMDFFSMFIYIWIVISVLTAALNNAQTAAEHAQQSAQEAAGKY